MGMRAILDEALFRLLRRRRGLDHVSMMVVLHVERLYDDRAFHDVLDFCEHYLAATGHRALATVITPLAPILREELAQAGFSPEEYARRIEQLAKQADIGLHGHYLRTGQIDDGLIHAYWSERAVVHEQMRTEVAWLESRGLMNRRVYSAGWWYLDRVVRESLRRCGFMFDFSPATSRYNQGALTWSRVRHGEHRSASNQGGDQAGLREVWAVTGLCGYEGRTPLPRQLLQSHGLDWLRRRQITVSLYNHDWDMQRDQARATIADLQQLGIRFIGLDALAGQATT